MFRRSRTTEAHPTSAPSQERLELYRRACVYVPDFNMTLQQVVSMGRRDARGLEGDICFGGFLREQEERHTGETYWCSDEFNRRDAEAAAEIARTLNLENMFKIEGQ